MKKRKTEIGKRPKADYTDKVRLRTETETRRMNETLRQSTRQMAASGVVLTALAMVFARRDRYHYM